MKTDRKLKPGAARDHSLSGRLRYTLLLLMLLTGEALARNIVFISIDDMRVDAQAIIPHIDALAAEGTRYTKAYTTAAWCLPARTSVLFGLSPETHGVGVHLGYEGYEELYANSTMQTLPEVFSAAGYTTASVGKVFHTPEPTRWDVNGPTVPWENFDDLFGPGPFGTFMHSGPYGSPHPDQEIADWAVDFINNQEGPFFLAVGFFQPHLPWVAPQWAYDLYPNPTVHIPPAGDLNDEPTIAQQWANNPIMFFMLTQYDLINLSGLAQEYTRGYLAAVSHSDAMVGQVLAAIDDSTTDVILWSDHGFHLGEKFHWRKQTLWEPVVKVPLIIKSPAIPTGEQIKEVSLLDLAPTALDLAGLPPFAQFEGVSLRTGASPVKIYYEDAMARVLQGAKTINYGTDIAGYNLRTDPGELINLPPPPGCGGGG
ncbi:MAG: sulfatase-like hydrolase/transferase [Halioglobus sp.]|nr:sulfatase-like hydrolase/transferase [Halioglobus sp.]